MSADRTDITLILPAFNEASRIAESVRQAIAFFEGAGRSCEIVVAADGTDGTREIVAALAAADPRIKLIGGPERRGKGRGVREAVAIASGDIIGYADADNKVPIEDYLKLDAHLQQGADMAVGSRGMARSVIERRQPLYRRVGSKGFGIFMHTVVGLPAIRDTQCGFKFFRRDAAKWIFERQTIDGYMFDVEILALATRAKYRIVEVPIRWHDDGDSRLDLVAGNIRNVRDIFRIAMSRRKPL